MSHVQPAGWHADPEDEAVLLGHQIRQLHRSRAALAQQWWVLPATAMVLVGMMGSLAVTMWPDSKVMVVLAVFFGGLLTLASVVTARRRREKLEMIDDVIRMTEKRAHRMQQWPPR